MLKQYKNGEMERIRWPKYSIRVYIRDDESRILCALCMQFIYIFFFCVLFRPVIFAVASSIVFVSSVRSLVSPIIWSGRFVHNPHALNDARVTLHLLLLMQFRIFGPAMATINPMNCAYLDADRSTTLRVPFATLFVLHRFLAIISCLLNKIANSFRHFYPPRHNRAQCCVHTVNLPRCGQNIDLQNHRARDVSSFVFIHIFGCSFSTFYIPPNVCCFYYIKYHNVYVQCIIQYESMKIT